MLAIHKSQADLSRRAVIYDLHGLSLREFINIELGLELPTYSLEEILTNHLEIAQIITSQVKILKTFGEYLEIGYYPFYLEGKSSYGLRLEQTINTILDVDLAYSIESNVENIYKLKKLLHSLANSVPFQPNISKLAGSFELSRNSLNKYLVSIG
jgi:predicted AAA+ superfamily ATPase